MRKPRSPDARPAERLWRAPVALNDVPESGLHVDLAASEQVRAAVANAIGLRDLRRLEASFDVTLRGRDGLHVVGHVKATVGQFCVVTLDPVVNEVEEPIDLVFAPGVAPAGDESLSAGSKAVGLTDDLPDPLVDGTVDLGAIAIEFLLLGIDPYPRKPGVVFDAPAAGDDSGRPFAALATLKNRKS